MSVDLFKSPRSSNPTQLPQPNNLFLDAEIGHRSKREGFPSVSRDQLEVGAVEKRRAFLSELASAPDQCKKYPTIRELKVSRSDYVHFGGIILDYVEALAEALDGLCPTISELAGNLAHDSRIGHVHSREFETTVRVLLSGYFSKVRHGPPLWVGSVENIYHAVVYRFPAGHLTFPLHNIPGAILSLVNDQPGRLFSTLDFAKELGFSSSDTKNTSMLDRALQLLIHTGDIVQHPNHPIAEGSNSTTCVWSSKSGPWIKPPLLNPLLQVLHVAAQPLGGFLRDLRARDWQHAQFSHHSIKSAAETLATLNLIHLSLQPEDTATGPGKLLQHVRITEAAQSLVTVWKSIPIGDSLPCEVYNPLRQVLVTRTPLSGAE